MDERSGRRSTSGCTRAAPRDVSLCSTAGQLRANPRARTRMLNGHHPPKRPWRRRRRAAEREHGGVERPNP